ncbi:MAG: hypothetical protein ACHQHN_03450 [Sphingobacteriales bacterium]
MRSICLFITTLFFGLSAIGQQITLGGSVNITLPAGSAQLTQAAATTLLQQKFPTYPYTSEIISLNSTLPYTYCNVNGNLLQLYYKQADGLGTYLTSQKSQYDAMGSENGMNTRIQYASSISTIGNNPVLLTYHTGAAKATYSFICSSNVYNTGAIIGTLNFAPGDKTAVTATLNTILSSIAFVGTFNISNKTTTPYQLTFKASNGTSINISLPPSTNNLAPQIPVGTYTLIISPAGMPASHNIILGNRPIVTGAGTTFTNVNISSGSLDLSLLID